MRRYLETLFRHKLLFLLPLVAVPLVTVVITLYSARKYEVLATIWIESANVLEDGARSASRGTPNEVEAESITDRLVTESFRQQVMDRVGLTAAIQAGEWPAPSKLQAQLASIPVLSKVAKALGMAPPATVDEATDRGLAMIKDSLKVTTKGSNLIILAYAGPEPQLGQRLLEESIRLYDEINLEMRRKEASYGVELLTQQLQSREEELKTAAQQLETFQELYPPPLPGQQRPPDEETELARLQRTYSLAQSLYETTLRNLEQMRLTGEASVVSHEISFQVIDPPVSPDSAGVSPRQIGMMGAMGVVLGFILAIVPIVLLTWRDESVRSGWDVQRAVGASSILEVPLLSASPKKQKRLLQAIASTWAPRGTRGS